MALDSDSGAAPGGAMGRTLAEKLLICQQRIGYKFGEQELLLGALTHASGADSRLASNERLEFLGDAVLGFAVCDMLFHRFPGELEGELTRLKSIVVSRETCARVSRRLKLEDCLIVGKGMSQQQHLPQSLLAAVLESLIAAVYLDGGLEAARTFIEKHITPEIDAAASDLVGRNYKSLLQQLVQQQSGATPMYYLLQEKGPDHDKWFKMVAQVGGRRFLPAWGRNKKEAEQRAAANAWRALRQESTEGDELEPDDDPFDTP